MRKGFAPLLAFGLIVIVALGVVLATQFILPGNPGGVSGLELKKFTSCDQISSFLQDNSGGTGYGAVMGLDISRTMNAVAPSAAGAEKQATAGGAGTSSNFSATNVQVAGVDEPDIVKNDGKYIYTVSGESIFIIDAYPAEGAQILSQINSSGVSQIFVNGDRLVVFGNDYASYGGAVIEKMGIVAPGYYPRYSQKTYIHVYDITDRNSPVLKGNFSIEGNYYDARMIGDYIYAVINKPVYYAEGQPIATPMVYSKSGSRPACGCSELYYFDVPDYSFQFNTIASLNVKDDNAEPKTTVIMSGYTENMYVSADNIYIANMKRISYWEESDRMINAIKSLLPADVSQKITDAQNGDLTRSEKMQKIGEAVQDYYNSLTEAEKEQLMNRTQDAIQNVYEEIAKETEKTVIYKISIDNGNIQYKGKGEVPGHLLNQFSIDENGGYLRMATTTSPIWSWRNGKEAVPSTNNVYVLDSSMSVTGKLEDIEPGESIYSARFIGDRAYLVTFKQVDPLFVIDLSNPSSPAMLGNLTLPGYSDYLHPYDENHLIGIGKDVDPSIDADKVHMDDAVYYTAIKGVKLSLFDVTDVNSPKEIAKYVIGDRGTESLATSDHKAFLFSREKNLLVIPIQLMEINSSKYGGEIPTDAYGEYTFQGAYVFNMDLQNGFQLKGRITHVDNSTADTGYYWYYPNMIERSLYIGDNLYTISSGMVKANSLTDMSELAAIKLPVEQSYPYPLRGMGIGGAEGGVAPPVE